MIHITAGDGVAATFDMPVLHYRISRCDRSHGGGCVHPDWYLIDIGKFTGVVVCIQLLVPFAPGVAVVGALMNDVDHLPGVQTDYGNEQSVPAGIRRIVIPTQAIRISKTVSPYFLARPRQGYKRIIVWYAVAAVIADESWCLYVR